MGYEGNNLPITCFPIGPRHPWMFDSRELVAQAAAVSLITPTDFHASSRHNA